MDFWMYMCIIVCVVTGTEQFFSYKKKRLKEQSKTNNLALIYQILNTRQDLKLEDVERMLEITERK